MPNSIYQLLQEALQRNSKSTVLKALTGMMGLLLAAIICGPKAGIEHWVVVLLAVLLVITFVVFIAAFIFFAIKDPDLLRSEKFSIQKMAIQQGLIGDDIQGFLKPTRLSVGHQIEDSKPQNAQKEDK